MSERGRGQSRSRLKTWLGDKICRLSWAVEGEEGRSVWLVSNLADLGEDDECTVSARGVQREVAGGRLR